MTGEYIETYVWWLPAPNGVICCVWTGHDVICVFYPVDP